MMNHWILRYTEWKPEEHALREGLCTVGNGVIACRGAFEEQTENDYNYPGTYMAGGYNRATSQVADKEIENEDLVNWPNWLYLTFRHEDGEWFDLTQVDVLDYIQELDLKKGILTRKIKFVDRKERISSLISKRVVSMNNPHEAGIEWILIPENWSGPITIRSGIDGRIRNHGVKRYRDLESRHIRITGRGRADNHCLHLTACSLQSGIRLSMAAKTRIFREEAEVLGDRRTEDIEEFSVEEIKVDCEQLFPLRIEKLVAVYSSRDFAISDPLTEALTHVHRMEGFSHLKNENKAAWASIWEKGDIIIEDGDNSQHQMILRLHIFHLYQSVSPNSMGRDMGVPSRGWHGEAYRGHIFWDELYIFPYINLHNPQLARSLLMYRYRRLHEAKELAKKAGFRGCMFPWQSGSNGREESQVIHLNPQSGRWIPDNTHLQRHINAAIPYNIWQYYQCTRDIEFLIVYGAEIIFNCALFWASACRENPMKNRYEILGIVGPDEYHTQYPDSDKPGINNNAYTNFMAVWVMLRALEITELIDEDTLKDLQIRVGFDKKDMDQWEEIASGMFIPFNDRGLIMQFEGFDRLKELDWDKYVSEHGRTMRLDRILEKENDTPNRYKACKQADVLMLFYLFSSDELTAIFRRLGYDFGPKQIPDNIDYYQSIASHGSTLSRVIHSWVYARSDRNKSWNQYIKALRLDLEDEQGGTTSEGIHLGAMAATVDMVLRGYSGMEIRENVLWFNPRLPEEITSISFHLRYRGNWMRVYISHEKISIKFKEVWAGPVKIGIGGETISFNKKEQKEFIL